MMSALVDANVFYRAILRDLIFLDEHSETI
jgi:hypothetical protein